MTAIDAGDGLFPFESAGGRVVTDRATSDSFEVVAEGFQPQVDAPEGQIFQGDSRAWLRSLPSESVDMVFADPPYNIKKANWDNFASQEAYIEWSMEWIVEAARVLKPTGSLYICGFSEVLADLKHPASAHFAGSRWLVWHYRNKANLGSDWGRSHESVLHLRKTKRHRLSEIDYLRIPYGKHTLKYPSHPQADSSAYGRGAKERDDWQPHPMGAKPKDVIEVPTTCNGMNEKTPHPTQKPEELVRKFVFASSMPGELVVDPFDGSGTTAVVAAQLKRRFLACDLSAEYNTWAAGRLRLVPDKTPMQWFEFDRANVERRESIR